LDSLRSDGVEKRFFRILLALTNKKPGMVRRGHLDIHTDALAPCRAWLQAVVQIATVKRNKDCREVQTEVLS
jgi:hypothetical protein